MPERAAKRIDITLHRVGTGEIVAGQEHEIRMLAIDCLDSQEEPRQVFIAIHVEVADLAGDGLAMSLAKPTDRQVDARDLDLIDGLAPHAMQRAQRERRPPLS